jgi:acyl-CoA synthetase (AMP-forming)/AMP-acid ligase II
VQMPRPIRSSLIPSPADSRAAGARPGDAVWPASLGALLRLRALVAPDEPAYTFLENGEHASAALTWGSLDRASRAVAATLQERVAAGERVILLYPPGLDFIAALFGCLLAGLIAVPVAPPRSRGGRARERLASIVASAGPAAILSTTTLAARSARTAGESADDAAGQTTCLADVPWIATDGIDPERAADWRPLPATFDTLALLQYTSGSTAEPRGVMVTHGNLLHNLADAWHLAGDEARGPSVSWLPVTHDMGLVEGVLQPLWSGQPAFLMAPAAFLQRPARWLEAISRFRAVRSGGPNFAYDLCVRRVSAAERDRLDLSCWRGAFCGAEPVRGETLEAFARAFADARFTPRAFRPCYGLAEATLVVSSGWWDGRVAGPMACGPPAPGTRVAIVDPASGRAAAPGEPGEIWVAGPGVARGYWQRDADTARVFGGRLAGDPATYLRTGDLGRLEADGAVVVTGRLKDVLIVRGVKYFPQDLELTAERSDPVLRPATASAFAMGHDASGDRIVIVAEVDPRLRADAKTLTRATEAVRAAVATEHGVQLAGVAIVASRSVPRTPSGKLQRFACRQLLASGAMTVLAAWGDAADPLPVGVCA